MYREANALDRTLLWRGPMVIAVLAIGILSIQGVMTATDFNNTEFANCFPEGLPEPVRGRDISPGLPSYIFKSTTGDPRSWRGLKYGESAYVEYEFPEGCRLEFFALSYTSSGYCGVRVQVYSKPLPGVPAFKSQDVVVTNNDGYFYLDSHVVYPVHARVRVSFSSFQRHNLCSITGSTSGSAAGLKFVHEVLLYAKDIVKCEGISNMSTYYPLLRHEEAGLQCFFDEHECKGPVTQPAQPSSSPTSVSTGRDNESLEADHPKIAIPATGSCEDHTTKQESSQQVAANSCNIGILLACGGGGCVLASIIFAVVLKIWSTRHQGKTQTGSFQNRLHQEVTLAAVCDSSNARNRHQTEQRIILPGVPSEATTSNIAKCDPCYETVLTRTASPRNEDVPSSSMFPASSPRLTGNQCYEPATTVMDSTHLSTRLSENPCYETQSAVMG